MQVKSSRLPPPMLEDLVGRHEHLDFAAELPKEAAADDIGVQGAH
jgi:hypothetical protein